MFGIYYKRCMFFSDVELFWYKFRIGNSKNTAQKCFERSSASNKMASQMNVEPGNVTSQ